MTGAAPSRVLVTIGDPNGVGPEIAIKAAAALADDPHNRPILIGDRHVVSPIARSLGLTIADAPDRWGDPDTQVDLQPVHHFAEEHYRPGAVSAAAGSATVAYVSEALALIQSGTGRAIVGCPHSETAVNASGRRFSGYPDLLAELLETGPNSVFMMLIGGGLRVIHATLHEGIRPALDRLTPDLIQKAVLAGTDALKRLGIDRPKIGLFGINPHAGEGGLFGNEDDTVVVPARDALRALGHDIHGPEGADTMLARDGYDAFVAMYHDQGHIPVKQAAGRTASALSVGGGIVFSSVGHGAAFDIAGKGIADPEAVLRTIRLVGGQP